MVYNILMLQKNFMSRLIHTYKLWSILLTYQDIRVFQYNGCFSSSLDI